MFVTNNEGRFDELDEINARNKQVRGDLRRDRGVLEMARRTGLSGSKRFFGMEKVDKKSQRYKDGECRDIRNPLVLSAHSILGII